MAEGNRAVHSASLALASLYDSVVGKHEPAHSSQKVQAARESAFGYYNESIRYLTRSSSEASSREAVLVCCLMFIAFEMWDRRSPAPLVHVNAGINILRTYQRPSTFASMVRPCLIRLQTAALVYTGVPLGQSKDLIRNPLGELDLAIPELFHNACDAYERMDTILRCILRVTLTKAEALPRAVCTLHGALSRFLAAIQRSTVLAVHKYQFGFRHACSLLCIHQRVARIMLNTLAFSDEMLFDMYFKDFEYILCGCERLLRSDLEFISTASGRFSETLGIIPPLFFVATRCRSTALRQRAIICLHATKRHERSWTSCTAYQVASIVIRTEEVAQSPANSGPVSKDHRIQLTHFVVDKETSMLTVSYRHAPWNDSAAPQSRTVPWTHDHTSGQLLERGPLRAAGYSGVMLLTPSVVCDCFRSLGTGPHG